MNMVWLIIELSVGNDAWLVFGVNWVSSGVGGVERIGDVVVEKWGMCTQGKLIEIRESIQYDDISS